MSIIHIDSSGRIEKSHSRKLSRYMVEKLKLKLGEDVITRDIGALDGLAYVDDTVINGMFKSEDDRSQSEKEALSASDTIISEAIDSKYWVLAIPIYNFSMPATFKTWADMLARLNVTFKYSGQGPEGLLKDKKVFAIITSGGTEIDSDIDFLTPWLRHYMKFIGVDDLTIISADRYSSEKDSIIYEEIDKHVDEL